MLLGCIHQKNANAKARLENSLAAILCALALPSYLGKLDGKYI
jgi:hypothetical protein